jgi:hypothetical protein
MTDRFKLVMEDVAKADCETWVDEQVRLKKERGEWTDCDEYGHDLPSVENMVCRRCGVDFGLIPDTQGI